ncbi:hypothetical protein H0N96_03755 [Candidatus Micrarchaeota archaeon]|nr:hypothetical protein [Candidatus Micrarchaeota archaeon]
MFNNKLFGLKFLKRTLEGVEGASVLPWKVYKKPEEFNSEHFPKAKRFLIRTNLSGNVPFGMWAVLPREDAYQNVKPVMKEMLVKWHGIPHGGEGQPYDPDSIHFIVHGVDERKEYVANGRIYLIRNKVYFSMGKIDPEEKRFISNACFEVLDEKNRNRILTAIKSCNLAPEQAEKVYDAIMRSYKAIAAKVAEEGFLRGKEGWDARFSIHRNKPFEIEFYDFLHIKGQPCVYP